MMSSYNNANSDFIEFGNGESPICEIFAELILVLLVVEIVLLGLCATEPWTCPLLAWLSVVILALDFLYYLFCYA